MNGEDLAERVIRLEAQRDALELAIKSELRGYLDGQIKSINHNAELNRRDVLDRIERVETTVWGPDGGNGIRQKVRRHDWALVFAYLVIGLMAGVVGIKLPGFFGP